MVQLSRNLSEKGEGRIIGQGCQENTAHSVNYEGLMGAHRTEAIIMEPAWVNVRPLQILCGFLAWMFYGTPNSRSGVSLTLCSYTCPPTVLLHPLLI